MSEHPFTCPDCEVRDYELTDVCTEVGVSVEVTCNQCGRSWRTEAQLSDFYRIHRSEVPA